MNFAHARRGAEGLGDRSNLRIIGCAIDQVMQGFPTKIGA